MNHNVYPFGVIPQFPIEDYFVVRRSIWVHVPGGVYYVDRPELMHSKSHNRRVDIMTGLDKYPDEMAWLAV